MDSTHITLLALTSLSGRVAGILALSLMALSLPLMLKQQWVDRAFGGLISAMRWHHRFGRISLLLAALHPLLLWAGAGASIGDYLVETGTDSVLVAGWLALLSMLAATWLPRVFRFSFESWQKLHMLNVVALALSTWHWIGVRVPSTPSDIWMLSMLGIASLSLIAWALTQVKRPAEFMVTDVQQLSDRTTEFRLQPLNGKVDFAPAQFVYARFFDPRQNFTCRGEHPFTITSTPSETTLRLSIKEAGDCTSRLSRLGPGSRAWLRGPFGRFGHRANKARPQIWIGGGMGIAPFLGLAKSLPRGSAPIEIFYCVRNRQAAPYLAELRAAEREMPTLRVFLMSEQETGFPSTEAISRLSTIPLSDCEVFLSGPRPFLKALKAQLRHENIRASRIHTEEYPIS